MEPFTLRAMAKVNLGLDVVRRMENGYQQVKMIMQTVNLYDELTFEERESGIRIRTDREDLPADETNLIYKAAKALQEEHFYPGVSITLKKRIPMAAGMAGGSSDAAATFVGINRLFGLNLSKEELCRIGVKVGADVPYCIMGGTMLSEGIGEILTPLPDAPACWLVVAKPDISVSTKYVYENLHANSLTYHPDIDGVRTAIENGNLHEMCTHLENVLETVTEKQYPVISDIKRLLVEKGALTALMSGSGPTVFGIFEDRNTAERARQAVEEAAFAPQLYLTEFVKETCVEA